MSEHCVQYSVVRTWPTKVVFHTENMTDEEVKKSIGRYDKVLVNRFNRCPTCEEWTTYEGKLRTEVEFPAVKAALEQERLKGSKP